MKYPVGFPVTLKYTLNDLEISFYEKNVFIVGFARFFCLAFGDSYVKANEDTPILSET